MALLELCLLPLLTAQDPTPSATPPRPDATATTAPATPPVSRPKPQPIEAPPDGIQGDARERLAAAEQAGAKADPDVLAALTGVDDEAIAARAAWLLGRCEAETAIVRVREVATGSPHAAARLQAMHTLVQKAQVASFATAVKALEDDDRAVRTLAAQLTGKLRRPAGTAPLVEMIERGVRSDDGPDTDLQAALIALHDLGAADQLLRIATALDDEPAAGVGQALAWCFQELSPKLEQQAQTTLLLAALDHREPLLRRYVIGRLAELRVRSTAQALEGRLAKETQELRPLVEVALAQVRGDDQPKPADEFERAMQNGKALWAKARAKWDTMPMQDRVIASAIPVSLLLVLVIAFQLRRRRRQSDEAAATLALVAPSEEHLEHLAAEADEIAAEAEAQAWADDEAGEAQYEEGEAGDVETDGWGDPVATEDEDAYAEEPGFGRR